MSDDKSGAAFPHISMDLNGNPMGQYSGLSKREYFAGLAMQGMLANAQLSKGFAERAVELKLEDVGGIFANAAILQADNLLAALEASCAK